MKVTTAARIAALLAAAFAGTGCDPAECQAGKEHICAEIQNQACDTDRMEDARARVRDGCVGAAAEFLDAAEIYCVTHSTDFDEEACTAGCGSEPDFCGGNCTDVEADPANCGACGTACTDGQQCVGGACVAAGG